MNKRDYKKILIQQVHTSAKYREWYRDNRDDYVKLLKEKFGVESSKALDIDSLIALVDYLNYKSEEIVTRDNTQITPKQREKLLEVWEAYARDESEASLMRWIHKIEGVYYMNIGVVPRAVASKVISILLRSIK